MRILGQDFVERAKTPEGAGVVPSGVWLCCGENGVTQWVRKNIAANRAVMTQVPGLMSLPLPVKHMTLT